ncbi:MAG: hypothetical protein WD055_00655 [Candidatus Dependentiae bacterium]
MKKKEKSKPKSSLGQWLNTPHEEEPKNKNNTTKPKQKKAKKTTE